MGMKGAMRAAALVASCVVPVALGGRSACRPGCERPATVRDAGGMSDCGDRAAVLGDVTGGCVTIPPGRAGLPGAPADPGGDLPQLPVALPAGALPVSLGATPALPRLDDPGQGDLPRLLPGALPPIHTRPPARTLPGLPSIPVVRPVPARTQVTVGVRERGPARQLGALALGGLLAAYSAVRCRRGRNVIYSDQ